MIISSLKTMTVSTPSVTLRISMTPYLASFIILISTMSESALRKETTLSSVIISLESSEYLAISLDILLDSVRRTFSDSLIP